MIFRKKKFEMKVTTSQIIITGILQVYILKKRVHYLKTSAVGYILLFDRCIASSI